MVGLKLTLAMAAAAVLSAGAADLRISEIMPKGSDEREASARGALAGLDPNGLQSGWVEIENTSDHEVDLADYRFIRVNRGKKLDTAGYGNFPSWKVPARGRTVFYTSERYANSSDMSVSAFATPVNPARPMVYAGDSGEEMLIWPDKVNPRKFPFVRLYYAPGGEIQEVVDTVVIPSDLPEGASIVVGETETGKATQRWICLAPTKNAANPSTDGLTPIGPNVGPLYEIASGKKTGVASEFDLPVPPAKKGSDYLITFAANPAMNPNGATTPREEDAFAQIELVYRKDLNDATLKTKVVDLATLAVDAKAWGDQYTVAIPAADLPAAGHLVQWKFRLTDQAGNVWTSPSHHDLDDGYEWYGTIVEPPADLLSPKLATWHLFADAATADNTNGRGDGNRYMNLDTDDVRYPTNGARVAIYDSSTSNYYDYVRIDLRGNTSKGFNKKSHGLRFAKSHPMAMTDCVTGSQVEGIRKTSLIAEYADPSYLRQLACLWLFNRNGSPCPFHFPVRVNLNGAFYQLAFNSERFEDELIGDVLKLDKFGWSWKGVGELKNSARPGVVTTPDDGVARKPSYKLEELVSILPRTQVTTAADRRKYSRAVAQALDLPAWLNYLALTRITQECDDVWANIGVYCDDPEMKEGMRGTGTWRPLTYDLQLSFGQWYVESTGCEGLMSNHDYLKSHPFYGGAAVQFYKDDPPTTTIGRWNTAFEAIFQSPKYRRLFTRRLRTLMDGELGAPGAEANADWRKSNLPVFAKMREIAALIAEDATADRRLWGVPSGAPIYVWKNLDTKPGTVGEGLDDLWYNYVVPRREHLFVTHSVDNAEKPIGYGNEFNAGIPHAQSPLAQLQDGLSVAYDSVRHAVVIRNANTESVDLSGWALSGPVAMTLPPGTVVDESTGDAPGEVYVTADRRATVAAFGSELTDQVIVGNGECGVTDAMIILSADDGTQVVFEKTPVYENLRLHSFDGVTPTADGDANEWITLTNLSPTVELDLSGVSVVLVKEGDPIEEAKCVVTLAAGTSLAPGDALTLEQNACGWKKITNGKIVFILTGADGVVVQKLMIDQKADAFFNYYGAGGKDGPGGASWLAATTFAHEGEVFAEVDYPSTDGDDPVYAERGFRTRLENGDFVHTWKKPGTYSFTLPESGSVRYLVIGGGGAGGTGGGGGGGAGAVKEGTLTLEAGTKVSFTVGAGGKGHLVYGFRGSNGEETTLTVGDWTISAAGGGAGGSGRNHQVQPNAGASGGGAGAGTARVAGGAATDGHAGGAGSGTRADGCMYAGGGGGGAGSAGADAKAVSYVGEDGAAQTVGQSGNGGDGVACDITGEMRYYGAGGGGAGYAGQRNAVPLALAGKGGKGGGGNGAIAYGASNVVHPCVDATAGEDGTGAGGGAGGFVSFNAGSSFLGNGASGGSGVVILRYASEAPRQDTDSDVEPTAEDPGELAFARVFSDHAVLQRGKVLKVWGYAPAGTAVTVAFANTTQQRSATGTASADGTWEVTLDALLASARPGTLRVSDAAGHSKTLTDILVGDVWIADGQSNMDFAMWQSHGAMSAVAAGSHDPVPDPDEGFLAAAADPTLRGMRVEKTSTAIPFAELPDNGLTGFSWDRVGDRYSAQSAVAFHFARQLRAKGVKVPIGYITVSYEGTAISGHKTTGGLYRAMVAPLERYGITGAIFFQGDNDMGRVEYANDLMTMVGQWREAFGQGDFPFYWVQLEIDPSQQQSEKHDYRTTREQQRLAIDLISNGGMAVSFDVSETDPANIWGFQQVHFPAKATVGERLAALALVDVYGVGVVREGPNISYAKLEGDQVRVIYRPPTVGSGLAVLYKTNDNVPPVPVSEPLDGFELSEDGATWVAAEAVIDGVDVVVSSATIAEPRYVRYAAQTQMGVHGNLYNAEGLPATPFTAQEAYEIKPPPPPHAHEWGEWYVSRPADVGVSGEKRRDCQREGCEVFETEEIEPLPGPLPPGTGVIPHFGMGLDATFAAAGDYAYADELADGQVSLGCWVKLRYADFGGAGEDYAAIVSLCGRNSTRGPMTLYCNNVSEAKVGLGVFVTGATGANAEYAEAFVKGNYNDGRWHYVMGTYAAASGALNLYVDGALAATTTKVNAGLSRQQVVQIGRDTAGNARPFDGSVARVTLWNTALDPDIVCAMYTARLNLAGNEPGLIGYWPCEDVTEEACGVTGKLADRTGNGHPLTYGTQQALANLKLDWIKDEDYPFAAGNEPGTPPTPIHWHAYGAWTTNAVPTCDASGERTRVCTAEGCTEPPKSETETLAALGHVWGAWETTKEAEVGVAGEKTRTCMRDGCGATETEEIDPLPEPPPEGSAVVPWFGKAGATSYAAYGDTTYATELAGGQISLGCWFKLRFSGYGVTPNSDYAAIVSLCGRNSASGPMTLYCNNAEQAKAGLGVFVTGTTGGYQEAFVKGNYNDGAWHYLMGTYDAPSGALTLYVDGRLAATATKANAALKTAQKLQIGRDAGNMNRPFDGSVTRVSLWNTVVSEADAKAMYTAKTDLVGNEAGLIGYWPCEDETDVVKGKTPGTLIDKTTYGHNLAYGKGYQLDWVADADYPFAPSGDGPKPEGPTADGKEIHFGQDAFDNPTNVNSSVTVLFPTKPEIEGQKITFSGESVTMSDYYTVSVEKEEVSGQWRLVLELNANATPTFSDEGAGEEAKRALEVTSDGTVKLHLSNVKEKLWYELQRCETLGGDWDTVKTQQGNADFEVQTGGEAAGFYQVVVRDHE